MRRKVVRVPIPRTRDPFVNTPLISLGRGRWLGLVGDDPYADARGRAFVLDGHTLAVPCQESWFDLPTDTRHVLSSGRAGTFLLLIDHRVELWDMRRNRCLRVLARYPDIAGVVVQDGCVYLVRRREVVILEDALKTLR